MSEIKFRAWDNEQKKMFYSKTEQFDDSLNFRFGHFDTEEPVYMQFTGLHDKNGKEIYEGDIVRCYGGAYLNGIYEYDYVIEVRDIRDLNGIVHSENVEILGNKYENPELLEGEK